MIKVLYLRSSFDPGGTESLLLNLFNYDQDQIEFHYVLIKDGSLIHRLKSGSNKYYKVLRKRRFDLNVLKKTKEILKTNGIGIIHTHQMYELLYAFILKLLDRKLRLFHTIHGLHDNKSKWPQLLEQFLIHFTEVTFTVSHSTQNILKQKGYAKNKIQVLYNAVTLPVFNHDKKEFKKQIQHKNDDYILGMIGNFVWQKDQITLIKAFNLVKNVIPHLKIIFIGRESELSNVCKKLLNKEDLNRRVYFMGSIDNASQYMPIFNGLIMSTLMDTFGIVVIEALMQKVPVIATNIEVMQELSHHGKYFSLFEKQNPQDLANYIQALYQSENSAFVQEAYMYAIREYSYEDHVKRLTSHYSRQ